MKDFAEGKDLSTPQKAALALPTFGLSLFADSFGIGSGKGGSQKKRDALRNRLQEIGFAFKPEGSSSHHITLADGTPFDIGRDIGTPGTNKGIIGPKGKELEQWEIDWRRDNIGNVVGGVNPLAEILSGGDDKLRIALSGYLTNAALESGDVAQNIRHFYEKSGVSSPEQASKMIDDLLANQKVTEEQAIAFKGGINDVFAGKAIGPVQDKISANQEAWPDRFNNPQLPAQPTQRPVAPQPQSGPQISNGFQIAPGVNPQSLTPEQQLEQLRKQSLTLREQLQNRRG